MPGPRFTDIRRLGSVDSTNRYLLDEARDGSLDGVVAVAEHQSAGRGRLGRSWEAPPGANLLLSVLLRPDLPAPQRHLASVVVALAASDAVHALAGLRTGLKWPNDLLGPDGRKLAGVLAEAELPAMSPLPGAPLAPIVVGIGINVNWPAVDSELPDDLVGVATSIRQLVGFAVDREELLSELLEALEPRVEDLGTASGRIRQAGDFRTRCVTIGTSVRVDQAGGAFEGFATDVDHEGHLVVEVDGGLRTIIAGDVVHVRPAG